MVVQEINQSISEFSGLKPTELHLCCIGNESSEIFLLQFFPPDMKQLLLTGSNGFALY